VSLVSSSAVVAVGGTQRITLDITGIADGDGPWELAVTIRAAASEARLRDSFDDRPRGSVVEVRRVPAQATVRQTIELPIGTCDGCVPIRRGGVHPVLVELRRPGGDTVADSFAMAITVVDARPEGETPTDGSPEQTMPTTRVAVVVGLHRPPTVLPDGTPVPLDLRSFVETTEALARHPDVPATVVVTAETVESIQRQGGGGGVLDTLRSSLRGRTVVAGPYVRWRPEVLESGALSPIVADRQADAGEVVRRLDPAARTDIVVWPSGPLPSATALDRLGAGQLVVAPDTIGPADGGDLDPARPVAVDVGAIEGVEAPALDAVIIDAELSAAFRPPGRDRDAVLGAVRVVSLLAARTRTAAAAGDAPRDAVVVLPEDSGSGLNTVLSLLDGHPLIEAVGIEAMYERSGEPQIVRPIGTPRSILPRAEEDDAAAIERQLRGVVALHDDPGRVAPLDHRLAATLAADAPSSALGGEGAEPATAASAATARAALREALRRELFVVELVPGGTYRLTARRGLVPITITTLVDGPMNVRIQASSDRLQFPGLEVVPGVGAGTIAFRDVVLDQRSTTILLPVSARTSGSFRFQVTVSTPSDEEVALSSSSYAIRSTAVSGVGVALTVASGVVLAGWWLRHVAADRRNERRRATAAHPAGRVRRRGRR
jgi:hypothetical protein